MAAALLDTSVVIDIVWTRVAELSPDGVGISALTVAELSSGVHLARDSVEAAKRLVRLQLVEEYFEPFPFDREAARSYGVIVAELNVRGRTHRRRQVDLMIGATAHARGLRLVTRDGGDFADLSGLLDVVVV